MNDWRKQNMLLHQFSNHKFTQLTRRMAHDQPVFEACDPTADMVDTLILVICGVCLIGIVALLAVGFL